MRRAFIHHAVSLLLLLATASTTRAQLPPPLPPPPVPSGNPLTASKAALGKTLFWDEQLSSSRTVSCGTCHQASVGGSDPRSVLASAHATHPGLDGIAGTADDITGSPGVVLRDGGGALAWSAAFGLSPQVTSRLASSHINAAYAPWLFADGRAPGIFFDPVTADLFLLSGGALENQAIEPPVSSAEMGHLGRDWIDVAARVAASIPLALVSAMPSDLTSYIADRSYTQLFAEAFGSPDITAARIAMAIASYERTLYSTQSPFDSLLAGTASLSPDETAGLELFQTHCASCHSGALTSNHQFHYIGVRPAAEDSGRFALTHNAADLGAFRTPNLRNAALRPAFMHDGRFSTLAEVVDFYDRGGDFDAPNKDVRVAPLGLSVIEKAQLVAFLGRPLTDPRVAASSSPFDRPVLFAEGDLVPDVLSGGVAGSSGQPPMPVALEPAITGNATFSVGVYAALGGAAAVLVVDDATPPPVGAGIPSTGTFARQAITLAGSGVSDGYGSVTLSIPDDPASYGRVLFGRWYVSDLGAAGGVAASAPFRFRIFGPHAAGLVAVNPTPLSPRHLEAAPNPFTSGTTARFDLARTSRVRLGVYDLSGRRLRRLFDRPLAMPGSYSVAWDGRDDAGRAVAAGVYFYRLETDREVRSTRVVRVR